MPETGIPYLSPKTERPNHSPDHWQTSVDNAIDQQGWRAGTRVMRSGEDVTVYTIDSYMEEGCVFRPEGPETFSLSVFLEGRGTLSVDGASPLEISPGSGVLFASNRYTRGKNSLAGGSRLRVVDIRFEPPLLRKLGGVSLARLGGAVMSESSLPEQDIFLIGFRAPAKLLSIAASMMDRPTSPGMAEDLFLYSQAVEALGIAIDAVGRQQTNGLRLKPLTEPESRKVHAAIALIEERFSADWTIARLSREVGLNERRLKEGFRLTIGKSIHAYLRTTRIEAAAELISAGASVTEAALAVGFENLSHFSKVFRAEKGVLPSRYGAG